MDIDTFTESVRATRRASQQIRTLSSVHKAKAIHSIAETIDRNSELILSVNENEVAHANNLDDSARDRLLLSPERLHSIVQATHNVADLEDPIGEVLNSWKQPSGVCISQVRVPLGVVGVIYENRPNVTVDAAVIALKSSNACVLRGSSTARETNLAIVESIHSGLRDHDIDSNAVFFVDDTTHNGAQAVMQARGLIDVLIPRGGPSLIAAIQDNATVPYIIDGAGNCHVYIDKDADLDMAEKIVINSKTQRTSVCNAAESLVVHRDVAKEFIDRVSLVFAKKDVEMVGDSCSVDFGKGLIGIATHEDFATEFLDLKISVAVVESLDGAIAHVNKYSTGHSEAIVTDNPEAAQRFMNEIDSAVVLHNTSTRFTDGERFGFGAEIGISTQKLHARGPMALKELTTYQYRVSSDGAIV